MDSLVEASAGQDTSKCSKVPGVSRHVGALQEPLLLLLQYLHNISDLYRPEAILAKIVLFDISKGLLAAVYHM